MIEKIHNLLAKIRSIIKPNKCTPKQCPYYSNCPYNPLKEYPTATANTNEKGILIFKE